MTYCSSSRNSSIMFKSDSVAHIYKLNHYQIYIPHKSLNIIINYIMTLTLTLDTGCRRTVHILSYRGELSHNAAGSECQHWASQHPNRHKYTEDSYFPQEGVIGARNYCRNPEGDPETLPWCYHGDKPGYRACPIYYCFQGKFIQVLSNI